MDKIKINIDFLEKVSKVIVFLKIEEEKEEIIKNLTGSFLLNFSRMMATDEKIAPLLKEFSLQTKNNDPSKLFEFLDSKNVDYQQFAKAASDETLNSFMSNLKLTLGEEKIVGLQNIIA